MNQVEPYVLEKLLTRIKLKTLNRSSVARRGEEGRFDSFDTPIEYNRDNLIMARTLIRETQPRGCYGEWKSMFEHVFQQVSLKTLNIGRFLQMIFKLILLSNLQLIQNVLLFGWVIYSTQSGML